MTEGQEIIIEDLATRHAFWPAKVKAVVSNGKQILVTYGLGDCFSELLHVDGDRILALDESDFWEAAIERMEKEIAKIKEDLHHQEGKLGILKSFKENCK